MKVKEVTVPVLFLILLSTGITCEDQTKTTDGEPVTATEGDASNAMLDYAPFGKRPAGHSFVRFGKRDQNGKGHSMLYFGKRTPDERHFVELLQYLQRNQEPSWKRGHSIMRFGKRASEKHNFIRFGKRSSEEDGAFDEETKRGGHSMMYFGKRSGHPMMYSGTQEPFELENEDDVEKRGGHSMMYFGKRMHADDDVEKRAGHSMMYFGKRGVDDPRRKTGHSMMYFGKRMIPDEEIDKKGGHSMMYFGKRMMSMDDDLDAEEEQKRAGHSMMYFGKRSPSNEDGSGRRQHSMMYFGKRADMMDDEEENKRGGHSMMYFGKREDATPITDINEAYPDVDEEKRASHEMLRFGKRQTGPYGVEGPWIHSTGPFERFANRYYTEQMRRSPNLDKKKHNMMHFGKRSVDDEDPTVKGRSKSSVEANDDGNPKEGAPKPPKHDRKKREAMPQSPLPSFSPFVPIYYSDEGYDYPEGNINDPNNSYSPPTPFKEIYDPNEVVKSKDPLSHFGDP